MKRFLSILMLLACAFQVSAQSRIKINAPNLVALDEQFKVTFVISGEDSPSDFQWTPPADFKLVWGPQKGSSTSVSIINGQHSRTSEVTYTYILSPNGTGKFTLPAATALVKGNKISSSPQTVEVVSNGAHSSQQQSGGNTGGNAAGGTQSAKSSSADASDIFMRLSLSKSSAVVGETLTATLKLYQRVNLTGFEDVKFPTFNGFWSQESAPSNIEFRRESVGDVIYNAAVLRSWTLIPQQAGEIKIDPAELVCLVSVRTNRNSGSIFDSFFQDEYQTVRKRVVSGGVTLRVRQLPSGAPASFGGGVGNFKMSAGLTRDSLSTHDAASLKVTVTGKGNLALLSAPDIVFPPDFEVYDVKTTDASGSRVFEYPFIPRSAGEFVIDPVEYSYYDIASGSYVTLRSEPMPISVSRSAGDAQSVSGSGQLVQPVRGTDVKGIGTDIRFIATGNPGLRRSGSFFAGSPLFWALTLLLILAAAVIWFMLRSLAARRADVVGSRNRAATKMALKRLSSAKSFMEHGLATAFYEELHKALLGFVSDKLNMPASDMSRDNIEARLSEAGTPADAVSSFSELLDACEFARYSPDSGSEALGAHYSKAVETISSIDNSMRSRHKNSSAAVLVALLMLAPFSAHAATAQADSLWQAGIAAYSDGDWAAARSAWESIDAMGESSSDLYYNIGNACFRQDDVAYAILYFEKALKLNPSSRDARYNLELAQSRVQDRLESVPEFFLKSWFRSLRWSLSSTAWAVLFLLFLAVALGFALVFLLSARTGLRKVGFYTGIASLLLAVLCFSFAFRQRSECLSTGSAVVTASVASAKSSPAAGSGTDLFVLHEGTEVKVLSEVGAWTNIELSDGRQGWLKSQDLVLY